MDGAVPSFNLNLTAPRHAGNGKNRRTYRSARRHFHNGQRLAVLRALTAARLYLSGEAPTLEAAAASCGSSAIYVKAAVILIKAENSAMLTDVLVGVVPLLAAAKQLKRVPQLVDGYRRASTAELASFGEIIGADDFWDHVINPAL
jgi:hypothetical protein